MHFVDADRRAQPILLAAALDPLIVGPFEFAVVPNDGGILRGGLEEKAVRIGLEHERSVDVFNLVLVERAFAKIWNEDFPDARRAKRAHGMIASIPMVERAYHTDALGIGRPNGKARSGQAVDYPDVRAELVINAPLIALAKKVEIHFAERGKK